MWIQWSLTRLVRWRVKDWASCFTACRFPLDDENDAYRSSPPQLPIRNMAFDVKENESKGNRICKKFLRRNRSCNKNNRCTRINLSTTQARNNAENTSSNNESSWPHFADEDYIVFCFREDGAFDVVKDCKSETPSNRTDCTSTRSSWPVTQKVEKQLSYGEEAKIVNINSSVVEKTYEDGHDKCPTSEEDINVPVTEVEEEEVIYMDTESASSSIRRRYQSEEIENHGMVSVASSDSNQSDSSGSFAFPVLGWEWMGSPAQMPKSEGLHLRKHKTISLSFQCCRF